MHAMIVPMTSPPSKQLRPTARVGQFAAVLWTGLIALLIAAGALFGFTWLIARKLPWHLTEKNPHLADIVKLAFVVVAGIGGVVALVVAYRRQRTLERDDAGQREQTRLLTERFGSAAQQLGDPAAPVRLAGVYAMAAVADEWEQQRQQCIDVLCGYLRLPYTGDPGPGQPSTIVNEHTWPAGSGAGREILTYNIRAGEREIRQSIVRVITAHLQGNAPTSWSDKNFDFSGALLERAEFGGAIFSGLETSFVDVTFSGEWTTFDAATFPAGGRGSLERPFPAGGHRSSARFSPVWRHRSSAPPSPVWRHRSTPRPFPAGGRRSTSRPSPAMGCRSTRLSPVRRRRSSP
jgi:hypothetical protein